MTVEPHPSTEPPENKNTRPPIKRSRLFVALGVAGLLIVGTFIGNALDQPPATSGAVGASSYPPPSDNPIAVTYAPATPTYVPGKYDQTWTKSYAATTCSDWHSVMSEQQRWAAAADMLVTGRKTDGGTTMPSDTLILQFEADMTTECVGKASYTINQIGANVYTRKHSQYRP